MEIPQIAPCGSCVLGTPFQCIEFNERYCNQIHKNVYFKCHCSLGEMQNNVDGGCRNIWVEGYKNKIKG